MNFTGINYWTPKGQGKNFELSPILTPLAPFRDRMLVVSGLAHQQAEAGDDGANGDHTRGTSSWLTGVHPKRTEGADVRNGISADQIAAAAAGQGHGAAVARARDRPQLPGRQVREQLQLRLPEHAGVDARRRRRCRPRTTRAWSSSGCSATAARRSSAPRRRGRTAASSIRCSRTSNRLQRTLGPARSDQGRRLRRRRARGRAAHPGRGSAAPTSSCPTLERPSGIPERFDEHVKLMYELQWLAFRADITRVVTFMLGRELNFRTYPEIGVTEGHHGLSHHADRPEQIAKYAKVSTLSGAALRLVPREAAGHARRRRHAAGSLAVPLRRGPQQPEPARPHDLPLAVVGGRGPAQGRRHLVFPRADADDEPAADACSTRSGVHAETLGDSTGRVAARAAGGCVEDARAKPDLSAILSPSRPSRGLRRGAVGRQVRRCVGAGLVLAAGLTPAAREVSLVEAVKAGDTAAAQRCWRSRPTSTRAEADGTTALHWAAEHDDLPTGGRAASRRREGRTSANRYGVTPLYLAAHERQRRDDRAAAGGRRRSQRRAARGRDAR